MPFRNFGWRPSLPDPRDVDFAFRARLDTLRALPPFVDIVTPEIPAPFEPAYNQGNIGSCGPNSACGHIMFDLQKHEGESAEPSRLFLYYNTRVIMGTVQSDSGVDNRSMMKSLVKDGWCPESLCPYNTEAFRQTPSPAAYAAATKITSYHQVPQNLDEMKGCLAENFPFIFGFTVFDSIDQAERTGDIPMPTRRDKQVGGHDVLIVGYDDTTSRFKLKNSWGPGWGKRGYGTIPYAYATSPNLSQDFWTIRETGDDSRPPPPPRPTESRTIVITGADRITVDGVPV